MTGQKNTHRRLMRVGQMLKLFLEKERVTTATLSREFHTTARTIQRDLSFLKQCGFPVSEAGPGVYRLDKDIFKNFELFDENELALIVALKCAVSQLTGVAESSTTFSATLRRSLPSSADAVSGLRI